MLARGSKADTRKRIEIMPNNAGVVDATPTRRVMHLRYRDSDGKDRTDSYDIPNATADADFNALAAAVGAVTNASMWAIGYTNWFDTGAPQTADALDAVNDSNKDNIVILLKNGMVTGFDFFIPANDEAKTMQPGTENPNPTTTEFADLLDAINTIWPGYTPASYRFTERKQKNRAIKP